MAALNLALLVLAPAPAVVFDQYCRHRSTQHDLDGLGASGSGLLPSCYTWQHHPVATVNSLLIWNVCFLFWVLSVVQASTWVGLSTSWLLKRLEYISSGFCAKELCLQLVDPYWTLIPALIEAYYASHPTAADTSRAKCAAALIAVWSLRLSHSYIRR